MHIIGIDPGKQGGFATLDKYDGGIVDLITMPGDKKTLIEFFRQKDPTDAWVFIEKAQAMPKNGAVSMFNYGQDYGFILGVIQTLSFPFTAIPPKIWTKVMHIGATGNNPKAKSLQIAERMYPGQSFIDPDSKRAKKPHDGLIDAVLIAEWGRRCLAV